MAMKVSKDPERKAMLNLAERHMRDVFICRAQVQVEVKEREGDRQSFLGLVVPVLQRAVPPTNPPLPPGLPHPQRAGPPPDEYTKEHDLCLHAYGKLARDYWADPPLPLPRRRREDKAGAARSATQAWTTLHARTERVDKRAQASWQCNLWPLWTLWQECEAGVRDEDDARQWTSALAALWPSLHTCMCTWYALGAECLYGYPWAPGIPLDSGSVPLGSASPTAPVSLDLLPNGAFRPPPGLELQPASSTGTDLSSRRVLPQLTCTAGSSGDMYVPPPETQPALTLSETVQAAEPAPTQQVAPTTQGKCKPIKGKAKGGKKG